MKCGVSLFKLVVGLFKKVIQKNLFPMFLIIALCSCNYKKICTQMCNSVASVGSKQILLLGHKN
jgi:hypothetical protein